MNGQWCGEYSGTNKGYAIIDIDDMGDHYEGVARLDDNNKDLPATFAFISTRDKAAITTPDVFLAPIDRQTGLVRPWDEIKDSYPGVIFSAKVIAKIEQTEKSLDIEWETDIGSKGKAVLPRSQSNLPSSYPAMEMGWREFKSYVSDLEHRRYIFRGQRKAWRLRTNFHRTGRANLNRFINEDIPTLYRHLSARTRHIFDLNNPDQNGAFYNLVQHHGYPTPLLDWTYSPFVAAYFAYHGTTNAEAAARRGEKVRIFAFDQKQWRRDVNQVLNITTLGRHFSVAEFISIENERMIPQQALSTVTNVDDIDSYIEDWEKRVGKSYLKIIDLPVEDRPHIAKELSIMGITPGALFPGLDGACQELKERFFDL